MNDNQFNALLELLEEINRHLLSIDQSLITPNLLLDDDEFSITDILAEIYNTLKKRD